MRLCHVLNLHKPFSVCSMPREQWHHNFLQKVKLSEIIKKIHKNSKSECTYITLPALKWYQTAALILHIIAQPSWRPTLSPMRCHCDLMLWLYFRTIVQIWRSDSIVFSLAFFWLLVVVWQWFVEQSLFISLANTINVNDFWCPVSATVNLVCKIGYLFQDLVRTAPKANEFLWKTNFLCWEVDVHRISLKKFLPA